MFDALSKRFDGLLGRLKGRGRLSTADVDEVVRDIRLALLEADVNVGVVNSFVERVRTRCAGEELSASITPGQQVIKIVDDELTATLGGDSIEVTFDAHPTVILLAGLQGSGKTTAAAKLAAWCKTQGRNPLLVAADLQRPAAVEQLRTLARPIGVGVWSADGFGPQENAAPAPGAHAGVDAPATDADAIAAGDPVATAAAGRAQADAHGKDVLIVDTAGRLAVDAELMTQVARISDAVSPTYTFLVVDSMMGQDAVATAQSFHATLEVDAVILSKLDGDARGGAALSVSEVVGRPIAFASVGEKIDEFEHFHPERMAGRILGMGDVLTLIERAEAVYEADEAEAAAQRLLDGSFTFDDFITQLHQLKKMGNLNQMMSMIPGVGRQLADVDLDDGRIGTAEAIVYSMTPAERTQPQMIDGSRRARIARGSGTTVAQVSSLIKQFAQMRQMMNEMSGFGTKRRTAGRGGKSGRSKGKQAAGARGGRTTKGKHGGSKRTGGASGGRTGGGRTPSGRGSGSRVTPKGRPPVAPPVDISDLDLQLPNR